MVSTGILVSLVCHVLRHPWSVTSRWQKSGTLPIEYYVLDCLAETGFYREGHETPPDVDFWNRKDQLWSLTFQPMSGDFVPGNKGVYLYLCFVCQDDWERYRYFTLTTNHLIPINIVSDPSPAVFHGPLSNKN